MAHGVPDWSITNGAKTTYQVRDLGELAVRLGSPVSFDRRGDVVWWDDFECSLNKWGLVADGGGGVVTLSTARARNGAQSALLTCPIGVGADCIIEHDMTVPVRSRVGVEASFCSQAGAAAEAIYILENEPTAQYAIGLRVAGASLQYLNSAGVWTTLVTLGAAAVSNGTLFATMKIVWDMNTHQYVRALYNDLTFDLSGQGLQTFASVGAYLLAVTLQINGQAGGASGYYFDDVIVTQNE